MDTQPDIDRYAREQVRSAIAAYRRRQAAADSMRRERPTLQVYTHPEPVIRRPLIDPKDWPYAALAGACLLAYVVVMNWRELAAWVAR